MDEKREGPPHRASETPHRAREAAPRHDDVPGATVAGRERVRGREVEGEVVRDWMPAAIRRISWGAIFAGAVVALAIQLMLNMLGLSIGLGAINPATEENPLGGIGTGAGIWLALAAIVALATGGWAAGRLAGLPTRLDGMIHGFVAWAAATFVMFYLVASGVGAVLSGAFAIVEQGARLVGYGVEAVAPGAGQAAEELAGDVSLTDIRDEAFTILRQTGREELQPENLAARAEQAGQTAEQAAGEAARSPQEAESEIRQALDRIAAQAGDVASEVDREAAVNVLVARTDMSREEARQTVIEYEEVFAEARERVQETARQLGETATQVSDDVLATMSRAALWTFVVLVLGAAAGAAGGAAGAPIDLPASSAVRRE